jgi:type VI secretion system secreted protein VgrG
MPRVMEITTPLGDDLLFHGMHAREELSRLFDYQLDLLSVKPDIDVDKILGKNVTVKLALPDDSTRYYNGFVTRFSQGARYGRYTRYSATVRPWLWFLTRTTDCRIFQEMTVPDIVKKVFADHPTADFAFELTGSYKKWTYCVQYRETDFNFVSRLLEQEGIYYYVRHTDGHNTVVLTDSTSKHVPTPGYEKISFVSPEEVVRPELERITKWDFEREIQPGVYVHDDYDLERPSVELRTRKTLIRSYEPSDYEVYDYPGLYMQKADGEQYAGVRIDEFGTQFEVAHASTNAKGINVGSLLTLEHFPREDQNGEYLILSASHNLQFSDYEALPSRADGTEYRCSFTAMTSKQQFRSRRSTPKPFVQGPQTAIVVGPAGDEIHTDKYGRVKVQFHWDRYGTKDENSSCWIRVSHPWAGKGWGSVATPRIGQEVIVEFLEGDPDQPIITGRVYNAEQQPPFGFPGGAVLSGIKSQTHKGAGYNELSMDDTAGKEKVNIHAQYDMDTTVEHDKKVIVKSGNRSLNVNTGTNTETIKGNASLTVQAGNRAVDVTGGSYTADVHGGDILGTASAAVKLHGQGAGVEILGNGGPGVKVSGTPNFEAMGASKASIDSPVVDIGHGTISIHGTGKVTINGDGNVEVTGPQISITGAAKVTITSGGSGIEVTPGGINMSSSGPVTITGPVVKVNS